MTNPDDPAATVPRHSDESLDSDQADGLDADQKLLIEEVDNEEIDNEEVDGDHDPSLELTILKDEKAGIYDAIAGDREIGGLTYNLAGGRVVLVAVSIFPQFRNQGAATKLIRYVLDDLRAEGKTATILCPIVRTFIDNHPEYRDVVDPEHPGVVKVAHR